MKNIILHFHFQLHELLDEKEIKFESINDYPKYMEYLINTKHIHEQISKDLSGNGINKEMQIILIDEMIKIKELVKSCLKGGKNAKNSKKSRAIQKNCNKNKKNKCKPNN